MRPTDAVPARLNESHLAEAFGRPAGRNPWGMATYHSRGIRPHPYTDDGLDSALDGNRRRLTPIAFSHP